ncbi:aspartate/glutamate racemase family protein [Amorphus sp. 3PC139-8]|uniref:aspartate/glutamate racemase family protein n=1 Tax=Amorphus sp. 3PC139-8 TaxID=2735676 RepID=UPI00345CAA95
MKKIGLIGGLSWVSTADYYKRLNLLTQQRLGGVASARIVLESVDRQRYVEAVIDRRDEGAACAQILEAARGIERAGADFAVITCNDVHRFVPEIAPQISIPFLHIAEPTAEAIVEAGLRRVALLGVRKTMEGDFYPEIFASHGIETIVPDEAERAYVHERIYEEMVRDVFTDETRDGYLQIIAALAERGAEGVVLACTEIPLLLSPDQIPIPSFSTTQLHCQAAVVRANV